MDNNSTPLIKTNSEKQPVSVIKDVTTGVYHLTSSGISEPQALVVTDGDRFSVYPSQEGISFVAIENDLVLKFADGTIVQLLNYVSLSQGDNPPGFILPDGQTHVGYNDLTPVLFSQPDSHALQTGTTVGSEQYSVDFGNVLGGVARLAGLRSDLSSDAISGVEPGIVGGGIGSYSEDFGRVIGGVAKLDGLRSDLPDESRYGHKIRIIGEDDNLSGENFGTILAGVEKLPTLNSAIPVPEILRDEFENHNDIQYLQEKITVTGVTSATQIEGANLVHTITMSDSSPAGQIYSFSLTDNTATAGADYVGTPTFNNGVTYDVGAGTITVPPGVSIFTITVAGVVDATYEGLESYDLIVGGVASTGTINDDDATSFSIGDVSISEGGLMTFTVTRTGDAGVDQTVDFATSIEASDTSEVADFAGSTGTLTFVPGVVSQTFTVQTTQDAVYEGVETFTVTLSNNSTGSSITAAVGVGTIIDDGTGSSPFDPGSGADDDSPTISITSETEAEGVSLVHTVTLSNAAEAVQTYNFLLADETASAGSDYNSTPIFSGGVTYDSIAGTIAVPAGVTSFTVTVAGINDSAVELSESYNLTIDGVTAPGTITDVVVVAAADVTYTLNSTTSINEDSEATATFIITLGGDALVSANTSSVVITPSGTATSGADYDNFLTAVSAAATATAGVSYDSGSQALTFDSSFNASGTGNFSFNITAIDDATVEGSETIIGSLNFATVNNGSATINTASSTTTITELDADVAYAINSAASISEDSEATATFTISLSGDALIGSNTSSVVITPSGTATSAADYDNFLTAVSAAATATAGVSYDSGSQALTFDASFNASGSGNFIFDVTAIDDATVEGSETIIGTLSSATVADGSATIGTATSTTTITELDSALSLDLDANNDNDTTNTDNYQTVFTIGGAGVALADSDVDLVASNDISSLTLSVAGLQDSADEKIIINGTVFSLDATLAAENTAGGDYQVEIIAVTATTATIVIKNTGGVGVLTEAEVESLLVTDMAYRNIAGSPSSGDRTIDISVTDSVATNSNLTIATISIGKELTVSDPTAVDEGKSAVFIIDLSETRAVATVLDLTVGGDATAGDYDGDLYYKDIVADGQSWSWVLASGDQVTIASGDTRVEVKVTTLSDGVSDNGEALTLTAAINGYAEADMANLTSSGTTTINDYPTLLVSAPVYVSEGNDAIFEVGLSSVKATNTIVDLSIAGDAVVVDDYDVAYQYSTDDGTTWINVVGDQITIQGDAAAITSVLVKITTIDDGTAEGDEALTLIATTNDPVITTSGIANAGTDVSDSTVLVDKVQLSVFEEENGVAVIGTTTVDTVADANYTYVVLGQGTNGTVTDNSDGTLRYTPDTDFSGTDTFSFTKIDVAGNRTTAEAVVTVTAVADTPNIAITVNNSVYNGGEDIASNGDLNAAALPAANTNDVSTENWYALASPGGSNKWATAADKDVVTEADGGGGFRAVLDGDMLLQNFSITTAGDYEVTFTISGAGAAIDVYWNNTSTNDDSVTQITPSSLGVGTHTVTIPASATLGDPVTLNALIFNGTGSIDNVSVVASNPTYTYDVNITDSLNDTDSASAQAEELQDVIITGVPAAGIFNVGTDNGGGSWTFTQAQLIGLTLTLSEADATAGFTLTSTTTSQELASLDVSPVATASTTYAETAVPNDVPMIGDNTLIMANESGFVGVLTDTVDTHFSTDGGNTFSWDEASSVLPEIYSEGQLVTISFDDANGIVTGTIDGGATTVFSVVIAMQDSDATDITYNQPSELLGVEEVFDGGIVLPGGGNNDTIVLGFQDSGGSPSNVDAIITAHNLIEDTAAEIASADAEHTVNTNNYYIGVDSNNMNAGDQLIMDFATVATDGDGHTTHENDVSSMEISLFNFGSEKSGDELYITIITGTLTAPVRETIILTSDPDFTDMKYTVLSPSGGTFIGVEFLAGNESSFKLGIESISAINYNLDFDMTLGYAITDANGDSDGGTVVISLDGDETILYDATKTAIDAGDEQFSAGDGDDTLVLATAVDIDFDDSIPAPELASFEIIDLTQNGNHSLTNLSVQDVIDMTDGGDSLVINAEAGDSVQLTNEWSQVGTTTVYEDVTTNINVTINGITPTLTSTIIDAAIIGMYYETASGITGTTNSDGGFSYINGDIVTFKLGSMTLGVFDTSEMANDGQLFLQDLAGVERTNLSDQYVINLAILLQSIDENGIAADGLVITAAMHAAFADDYLTLSDLTEGQLVDLITTAGRDAISAAEAMEHVRDELIDRTDLTAADFAADVSGNDIMVGSEGDDFIFGLVAGDTLVDHLGDSFLAQNQGEPLGISDVLIAAEQDILSTYLETGVAENDTPVNISIVADAPQDMAAINGEMLAAPSVSVQDIMDTLLLTDLLSIEQK